MNSNFNILKFSSFLLGIFIFYSCAEDSRMHNMVSDSVYLKDSQLNKVSVFNWGDFEYKLVVVKSGINKQSADVELTINESYLSVFNEENNTGYITLPPEYYSIINNKVSFSKDSYLDNFTIIFNSYKLKELLETTGKQYAIPCEIILSNTSIVPTFPKGMYSVIVPEIKEPYIQFDKTGLIHPVVNLNPESDDALSNSSLIKINYLNKFGDIPFTLTMDPQVLDDYNASVKEDAKIKYPLIPEAAFRFIKDSWFIPSGTGETYTSFEILKKGFIKNGTYQFGDYIFPIKLETVDKFNINPEQRIQLYHISFLPQNLDRSKWKVIDVSSEEPGDGARGLILDGKPETFWHSKWRENQADLPHYLIIDMNTEVEILGVEIMRRLDNVDTRIVNLELSSDGITYKEVGKIDFGPSDSGTGTTLSVSVTPTKARYLKCTITESNRPPSASIAEINIKGIE